MSYIKCKCGVSLNTEETSSCPNCEDIAKHELLIKNNEKRRARKREISRAFALAHPGYFKKKSAIYRKKHREERNAAFKLYYQTHKEYYRQKGIEYRAKMKSLNFSHVLV